jgi:hypothetical protein
MNEEPKEKTSFSEKSRAGLDQLSMVGPSENKLVS